MILVLSQIYGAQNILLTFRTWHHMNLYIWCLLEMIVLLYINLKEYQIPFYNINFNGKAILFARFYFITTYAISAYRHQRCEFKLHSIQHLCDKVSQWLAAGQWFPHGTLVSSTNKTECHEITDIFDSGIKHLNSYPNPPILSLKVSITLH